MSSPNLQRATASIANPNSGPFTSTANFPTIAAGNTLVAANISITIEAATNGNCTLKFGLQDSTVTAGTLQINNNLTVPTASNYVQNYYVPNLLYVAGGTMQVYITTPGSSCFFAQLYMQLYFI